MNRGQIRSAFLGCIIVLVAWALLVALSGGLTLHVGIGTMSSHSPWPALAVAFILAVTYVATARAHWRDDVGSFLTMPWPLLVAATAIAAAFLVGVEYSAFFAAGPDQSGYVSQAHRWMTGELRIPVPEWARSERWTNALKSAAPTGYAVDAMNTNLVPSISPGLPLAMAVFERIGGEHAVFYVVPLFGALAVWATYALGRRLAGQWAGAMAAVLLLCSPAFVSRLIEPMSDVPAAACWAVALLFACRGRSSADAFVSGVATGTAILIRSNTAPLALFPAALIGLSSSGRTKGMVCFALAAVPAAVVVGAVNANWYGSPLTSGYGSLDTLYALDRIPLNLGRYAGWLVHTQTPMVFLWTVAAFAVPVLDLPRRVVLIVIYPLAVFALYLPYLTFDDWAYLRFLLPAYPVVLAALAALFVNVVNRLKPRRIAVAAVAVVALSLVVQEWMFARDAGTFRSGQGESRFAHAVEFARTLPKNTIFVSDAYSGALHFYTGHDVLRWVMVPGRDLDVAIANLNRQGYPLYFIGDPFEVERLRREYADTDAAKRFDAGRQVLYGELFVASNLTPP
jgi:Dolichyl-phosphate-mannose-protein mannosyltransferase